MTNAEARFNKSLRPRKLEGSLGRTAQDGHLDSHTPPELRGALDSHTPPELRGALDSHTPPELRGALDSHTPPELRGALDSHTPPELRGALDSHTPPELRGALNSHTPPELCYGSTSLFHPLSRRECFSSGRRLACHPRRCRSRRAGINCYTCTVPRDVLVFA